MAKKVLITGSSGHLGEGLVRKFQELSTYEIISIDILPSPFTSHVGSITNRAFLHTIFTEHPDIDIVFHTATLHKPHVKTHSKQDFIDVNITGTLNLLEEAEANPHIKAFIFHFYHFYFW